MADLRIHFDQGPDGRACRFARPALIITAWEAADVPAAFDAIDRAQSGGAWLAGFASYELGFALEPRLTPMMPSNRTLPLLQFGVYARPEAPSARAGGPAALDDFRSGWDASVYSAAFGTVHDYICAGDVYQANLTFPAKMRACGSTEAIYDALCHAQPVRHGALVRLDGGPDILCRSPELFFRTDADGRIETRPMKGTQPRDADSAEDDRRRRFLQTDEKNRAENLMIVDLLRNDLSRICMPGSVRVPELFSVESYATVHQMTSLVTGRMRDRKRLGDILQALFPCGSITGAPKLRAMEILAGLEQRARGIYCGTIGWAAPDGRSEFSVAIRTLVLENGDATLNVGGGVVYDSTAESEYEEALWKARFACLLTPVFA